MAAARSAWILPGHLAVTLGAHPVAAAVLALDLVLAAWLAALIVGIVIIAVGGVLALVGIKRARTAVPPMPEDTMASVKRDVATVKENVR